MGLVPGLVSPALASTQGAPATHQPVVASTAVPNTPAPEDPDKPAPPVEPELTLDSEVLEGSTTIRGTVTGVQVKPTAPAVEIWIQRNREEAFRAPLVAADTPTLATAPRIVVNADGTFTAKLALPLAAGDTIAIQIVAQSSADSRWCQKDGVPIDCPILLRKILRQLSAVIPKAKVFLSSSLLAGSTPPNISGRVEGLAQPVIPANTGDSKTGAVATPGNLPLIGVDIDDPVKGASRALIQLTASQTAPAVQVNADGSFSFQLATPLTAGQKATLVVSAPAGHHFADGTESYRVAPELTVYSGLALDTPTLATVLGDNVTALGGNATPSPTTTATFNVAVEIITPEFGNEKTPATCVTLDTMKNQNSRYALLTSTTGNALTVATSSTGTFSLTLAQSLFEGESFRLVQVVPAGFATPADETGRCFSANYSVPEKTNWGRVHANFTAGFLSSNNNQLSSSDQGTFSQMHEFLALEIEKSWLLPGSELYKYERSTKVSHRPGLSSFFETRLTSIPVASVATTATSTTTSTTSTSAPDVLSSNPLTQAQTARLGAGFYLPILLTRWEYHHVSNALFIAPLAEIGFDTVTGASSIHVTPNTLGASTTSGSATITAESLYNFRGYGARIGHYQLSHSSNRAPTTISYLDVLFGPYSNLESLECNRTPAGVDGDTTIPDPGYPAPSSYQGSTCSTDYQAYYNEPVPSGIVNGTSDKLHWVPLETRKRVYRLDFEGLLNIPNTWFYVGFNANLGQKSVLTGRLDHGYAAPDDLRFFFGTRFDISTLLTKMGVGSF